MGIKIFGKLPRGRQKDRIRRSPNYRRGAFRNTEFTSINPMKVSMFRLIKLFLDRPRTVQPIRKISHVNTDLHDLNHQGPVVVWFGHSSYYLKVDGYKVLVDPVLEGNASPFPFFAAAFEGSHSHGSQTIPDLDLLVLTHDHYDHLSKRTLQEIAPRVSRVVCPLGVGAHLEYWGMDPERITELDWGESFSLGDDIKMTATPARHFSGRGLKRNQSLWCSFVLNLKGYRYFLGGDSGYDGNFARIGEAYGPFDLAFLECGQYGKYWPQIHMFPEQTVQAGLDLGARVVVPVHWGKFTLSDHPWKEPVRRFVKAASREGLNYAVPAIGEAFNPFGSLPKEDWWNKDEKPTG